MNQSLLIRRNPTPVRFEWAEREDGQETLWAHYDDSTEPVLEPNDIHR